MEKLKSLWRRLYYFKSSSKSAFSLLAFAGVCQPWIRTKIKIKPLTSEWLFFLFFKEAKKNAVIFVWFPL